MVLYIAFIRKSSGWRWMHLSWPWKNMELRYALCRALHNIGVSNFLLRHEIRSFQNIAKSTSEPSLEYLNFYPINLSFIITQSRQLSTPLTNLLGDRWRIHNGWPSSNSRVTSVNSLSARIFPKAKSKRTVVFPQETVPCWFTNSNVL